MSGNFVKAPEVAVNRFQILSLDGGGIKGLFAAAVLAAIEEDMNVSVTDHFDLIAGTSTGGIIAIGLGLGIKPRKIVEFYLEEGPNIFPTWFGAKWLQHWVIRKYSSKGLEAALKRCYGENKLFGESTKRLIIPSYNLGADDVYIFRTPHAERLKTDHKRFSWQVALATASAPTYFSSSKHIDNLRLIDGGVWANNPALVAIVEAHGTLGIPLNSLGLLSIGTSDEVTARGSVLNSGGILPWAWSNSALDVILRGQSIGTNNQAHWLLGGENVERLNPKVASKQFKLDGTGSADELIGIASHFARIIKPNIEKKFLRHKAALYQPIHKLEKPPQGG